MNPGCRMGLYQMESLRQDVLNLIKKSSAPKWQIIGTMICCRQQSGVNDEEAALQIMEPLRNNRRFIHPMDSGVGLTTHTPLFPPGKIIHVVRSHPKNVRYVMCAGRAGGCFSSIGHHNTDRHFDMPLKTNLIKFVLSRLLVLYRNLKKKSPFAVSIYIMIVAPKDHVFVCIATL